MRINRCIGRFIWIGIWLALSACGRPVLPTHPANNPTLSVAASPPTVTEQPSANTTQAPSPPQTPTPLPAGRLNIWSPRYLQDQVVAAGVMDLLSAAYPDLTVEWFAVNPASLQSELEKKSAAPDLVIIESGQMADLAASGSLAPWSEQDLGGSSHSNFLRIASNGPRVYALPWTVEPVVVFYRRDVFKKAGLSAEPGEVASQISTWDSLLVACQKIKNKTGFPCFDLSRSQNDAWLYEILLMEAGGGYRDEAGLITLNSTANEAVLRILLNFWHSGVTADEVQGSPAWLDRLASTTSPAALFFGTPSLAADLRTWMAPGTAGLWGTVAIPGSGKPTTQAYQGGLYLGISAESSRKADARDIARFLVNSPTVQTALYGKAGYFPAAQAPAGDLLLPDPFFAGQPVGRVYLAALDGQGGGEIFTQGYSQIHRQVEQAIRRVALGLQSPAAALQQAQEEATTPGH